MIWSFLIHYKRFAGENQDFFSILRKNDREITPAACTFRRVMLQFEKNEEGKSDEIIDKRLPFGGEMPI